MKRFSCFWMVCLFLANEANASGCGFYENFLQVSEVQDRGGIDSNDFEILSWGETAVRVRLKKTNEVLTLVLESSFSDSKPLESPQLSREDVAFSEGNGCGPIYNCRTGRYVLQMKHEGIGSNKKTDRFTWPVIRPYYYHSRLGWTAGDLIPTFEMPMVPPGTSDVLQCEYGDW